MKNVWRDIEEATVIVAFLTRLNPNVLYELGLAHGLEKPVIVVVSKDQQTPADLSHLNAYRYENILTGGTPVHIKEIVRRLEAILKHPDKAVEYQRAP
jgi:nucleoside 2-deoxyribosyltransferase